MAQPSDLDAASTSAGVSANHCILGQSLHSTHTTRPPSHYTVFEVATHGNGLIRYDTLDALTADAERYGTAGSNVLWTRPIAEYVMPSTYDFNPVTQAQADAISDNSHVLLFCGAWGSAKTETGLRKILVLADRFPGIKCRVLRWYHQDARNILLPRFLEMVPPQMIAAVNKQESTVILRTAGGESLVQFGGLKPQEKGQDRWSGTEYGFTLIDEATQLKDVNHFQRSVMRSSRQPNVGFSQVFMTCNAGSPGHWLYQWFYEGKRPTVKGVTYRLIEGPTIPRSAGILPTHYYAMLDGLTGILKQRYRDNKWVAYEGLVFPWDPRVQLIRPQGDWWVNSYGKQVAPYPFPSNWLCVQSCDFGFYHPLAYQWWRVGAGDYWFLQKQIHMTQRTVAEHSKQIHAVSRQIGTQPVAFCDHDAEDAATLQEHGIRTIPAYKARLAGQQVVYGLFPHIMDAIGEVMSDCRIYVCEDSLVEVDQTRKLAGLPICLEDELGGYLWATGTREDMVKDKDDGVDCGRYAIASYYRGDVGTRLVRPSQVAAIEPNLAEVLEGVDSDLGYGSGGAGYGG